MPSTAIVWLKRDLRLADHAPLHAARAFERAVALYIVEPEWLASPEFDGQHAAFVLDSLAGLRAAGLPLRVRIGRATEMLQSLHGELGFSHLLSHEETGPGWSYMRDIAVAAWCRERGVVWHEAPQTGVVRRLKTRNGWAARWATRMAGPQLAPLAVHGGELSDELSDELGNECSGPLGGELGDSAPLPTLASLGVPPHGKTLQAAGEAAGQAALASFLQHRGRDYRHHLSSPLTAEQGCSRLSPHLAFGTLSMRQVHQASERRIAELTAGDPADRAFAHALRGFAGRLRWHCHFMQKLEDEPGIEFHNFSRACDGLREGDFQRARFDAWCAGLTGFPMVDACMRSLRATGWLNFRMRAMLVSFAAYHLWLHWREPGLFLARQFLDFEAGIHWSQMQMQSGTTGINTLRIYSPTKQALEHDPQGIFIRRWLPELARVPLHRLAEPWQMTPAEQQAAGCVIGRDYPGPIVDSTAAVQHAKQRLYGLRGSAAARSEADAIQQRHGSRKSGLPPSGRAGKDKGKAPAAARRVSPPVATPQLDLFGADE